MHSEIFAHVNQATCAAENHGRLFGKRVGVQSLFCVRGWPCTGGSKALEGFHPLEDATVIQRLKTEGAVLAGSTRSSELGLGIAGDGAAKAVSQGLVHAALMMDTLGEARVAAVKAGLFGFKPSWGRVSRFGLMGLAPSMECCGMLASNLDDIARMLETVAHIDERDPSMAADKPTGTSPALTRAGVFKELQDLLEPQERSAFSQAVSRLEQAGLTIREAQYKDLSLFAAVHQVIAAVEASSSCGKFDGVRFGHRASGGKNWNEMYLQTRRESFGPLMKAFLFQGAYFQFEDYAAFEQACRIRTRLVQGLAKLLENLDVLVLPALHAKREPASPRDIEELYRAFSLTLPASVAGLPAIALPGMVRCDGRDLGLQLVGSWGTDQGMLALAQRLTTLTQGAP